MAQTTRKKAAVGVALPHAEARKIVAGVRSPLKKEILDLLGAYDFVPIQYFHGNTRIRGNFEVGESVVLVNGNLTIDGWLEDGVDADQTLLIVLGKLAARDIITLSAMVVTGDVAVRRVIYGNSLGDDTFHAGGDVRAALLVGDGHWFRILGKRRALTVAADTTASLEKPDYEAEDPSALFMPGLLADESLDLPSVIRAIRAGKPLLKAGRPQPTSKTRVEKSRTVSSIERDSKDLTAVPEDVLHATGLKRLSLANNEIKVLPAGISRLADLESLDLQSNNLGRLPDEAGKLKKLTTLHVQDNRLTSLPESLRGLTALTDLDVSGNPLKRLPKALASLPRLSVLGLSFDSDRKMSRDVLSALSMLRGLKSLDISSWKLSAVPEAVCDLSELTRLDLSFNKLKGLPESFAKLAKLRDLDLRHNGFRVSDAAALAGRLAQLPKLGRLTLDTGEEPLAKRVAKKLPRCKVFCQDTWQTYRVR